MRQILFVAVASIIAASHASAAPCNQPDTHASSQFK
jgi:hypothetical protein